MAGVSMKDLASEAKVAQEELGWGAARGMSGGKFATGCYWVTQRGVGPCYSPRMNSQQCFSGNASILSPSQYGIKRKKHLKLRNHKW